MDILVAAMACCLLLCIAWLVRLTLLYYDLDTELTKTDDIARSTADLTLELFDICAGTAAQAKIATPKKAEHSAPEIKYWELPDGRIIKISLS
jgi:hypothetical protein